MTDPERLSGLVGFATVGALTMTQDLAARVLSDLAGADADLVAEETLALVCTATARAAAFGLRAHPELAEAASATLLDLPLSYHDYLVGGAVLDAGSADAMEGHEDVYDRVGRKLAFYATHLPAGPMPGSRLLGDKMALWMGRVSPPRQPEMPQERLERLGLVQLLVRHVTLVRTHAERSGD